MASKRLRINYGSGGTKLMVLRDDRVPRNYFGFRSMVKNKVAGLNHYDEETLSFTFLDADGVTELDIDDDDDLSIMLESGDHIVLFVRIEETKRGRRSQPPSNPPLPAQPQEQFAAQPRPQFASQPHPQYAPAESQPQYSGSRAAVYEQQSKFAPAESHPQFSGSRGAAYEQQPQFAPAESQSQYTGSRVAVYEPSYREEVRTSSIRLDNRFCPEPHPPSSTPPAGAEAPKGRFVVAANNFRAKELDELEIRVGDMIMINVLHDDGWAFGINGTRGGKVGAFPHDFVLAIGRYAKNRGPNRPQPEDQVQYAAILPSIQVYEGESSAYDSRSWTPQIPQSSVSPSSGFGSSTTYVGSPSFQSSTQKSSARTAMSSIVSVDQPPSLDMTSMSSAPSSVPSTADKIRLTVSGEDYVWGLSWMNEKKVVAEELLGALARNEWTGQRGWGYKQVQNDPAYRYLRYVPRDQDLKRQSELGYVQFTIFFNDKTLFTAANTKLREKVNNLSPQLFFGEFVERLRAHKDTRSVITEWACIEPPPAFAGPPTGRGDFHVAFVVRQQGDELSAMMGKVLLSWLNKMLTSGDWAQVKDSGNFRVPRR
ncbi:hypothetical protein M427DRAFT_31927 [Gonapodya prolifera JEL478]|uniref:SH3 domain-containing protein n=1 Tax=Gonapodya prolifera (strain JEL478) TaxID=1344416 RepID=A0A139AGR6_GONPJ|nr:hypothetical protein M427DRAFT_31927 [Gonapodya prolifera JEL478]|eukprot:KXS15996.1 hypothetical protein M427DRAFT_31927 [Gonapodya prolifera JEL478]